MHFLTSSTGHFKKSVFGETKVNLKRRNKKNCFGLVIILAGIMLLANPKVGSPGPNFQSFLTKDLTLLTPATRFSRNDRISLQTIWTGLMGTHEEKVLWIRPNGHVRETTRVPFTIPSGTGSYRTSACCLNFPKSWFFLTSREVRYIGIWRAQLFLDGKFLSEYAFEIS